MRWLVVVALAACGKPERAAPAGEPVVPAPIGVPEACRAIAFAETTPVPEASGAAWLDDGSLVVVGDSGNDGAYGILDGETGETREEGLLPLGPERHDDLEGLARRGGRLVGITSPGWILEWERRGRGFELVAGPYPLGPVDVARGRDDDGMVCAARRGNCGRNYEGLCLAAEPGARCVGFAASKADGHLYCLVERDGQLAVVREGAIAVARPGAIADCAFGDDGAVYVGGNLLDLGRVYRVTGWDEPGHARVEVLGSYGVGNPEVLALRGDVMIRMSDTNGAPSLAQRYRCRR